MGDESAVRRFRQEHAQVFAMLWRRLGEYDLVDAALADAYLAATASWPASMPHNPATWMATVALSATTGVVSRKSLDAAEPVHPHDDLRAMLWTCCHPTLSADERAVCLGRAAAGLMPTELAALLDVPVATVNGRLDAAKKALRQSIARAAVTEDERDDRTALVAATIDTLVTAPGAAALALRELLEPIYERAFAEPAEPAVPAAAAAADEP